MKYLLLSILVAQSAFAVSPRLCKALCLKMNSGGMKCAPGYVKDFGNVLFLEIKGKNPTPDQEIAFEQVKECFFAMGGETVEILNTDNPKKITSCTPTGVRSKLAYACDLIDAKDTLRPSAKIYTK